MCATESNEGQEEQVVELDLQEEWRQKHEVVREAYEECLANPNEKKTLIAESPQEYHMLLAQLHHHRGCYVDELENDQELNSKEVKKMRKPLDQAFERIEVVSHFE